MPSPDNPTPSPYVLLGMLISCWRHSRYSSDAEAAMNRAIELLAADWQSDLPDVVACIEKLLSDADSDA